MTTSAQRAAAVKKSFQSKDPVFQYQSIFTSNIQVLQKHNFDTLLICIIFLYFLVCLLSEVSLFIMLLAKLRL